MDTSLGEKQGGNGCDVFYFMHLKYFVLCSCKRKTLEVQKPNVLLREFKETHTFKYTGVLVRGAFELLA